MKKIFYFGLLGLIFFEIANVYFIMPMPGSQRMKSIDLSYFLYSLRWIFRSVFGFLLIFGLVRSPWKRKWTLAIPLLLLGLVIYMANFKMAADAMFKQPKRIRLTEVKDNQVDSSRLIIGIEYNGVAKAYPIQYLGYHHFVYDSIGNQPLLITYCTVCRTGRVFDPTIDGLPEKFRLVGMDHFNAMLEDATTHSWWRQSTGEAITGKRKGWQLREIFSSQTSLAQWIQLHPSTTIMQADEKLQENYDSTFKFEAGKSDSKLTGTDSLSWGEKSWVIGVKLGKKSKAIDWNELKKNRLMESRVGNTTLFILLAPDNKSFFAFENQTGEAPLLRNDTLTLGSRRYRLNGRGIDTTFNLKPIQAYQEFWHSWKTFQPNTEN